MGQSTDAILAYGYILPEGVEYDVDGLDPDSDDYEGFDEEATKRLRAAGLTGVHITRHCSHDYPMYLLTTSSRTAWRGSPVLVDAREMTTDPDLFDWEAKLRAGMDLLGLTSEQSEPGWILCSDWS